MSPKATAPQREETREALAGLKDFQRATVDYVFDRLYSGPGPWRYLVADEVGLGKTMIARGVVARMIDVLRAKNQRVNIVYQKVLILGTEAEGCAGEDVSYIGATNVQVEVDPGIPQEDPTIPNQYIPTADRPPEGNCPNS